MRKDQRSAQAAFTGLNQRQIAGACAIGHSTVVEYLKHAETAGLTWTEIVDWGDDRLLARLSPVATPALPRDLSRLSQPDYAGIHTELQMRKHLTLQLFAKNTDPASGRLPLQPVLRALSSLEEEARGRSATGAPARLEKIRSCRRYAGATIPSQNLETGEVRQAQLFGASNYTFVDLTWTEPARLDRFPSAPFEFFQGVAEIVVPDNLKSGVTRNCRYEDGAFGFQRGVRSYWRARWRNL